MGPAAVVVGHRHFCKWTVADVRLTLYVHIYIYTYMYVCTYMAKAMPEQPVCAPLRQAACNPVVITARGSGSLVVDRERERVYTFPATQG